MTQHALTPREILEAAASLAAADFERFVSEVLALKAQRTSGRLSATETDLLLRINRGLPVELRARYDALRSRLADGTLSADEHAELLRLTDEVEHLQADRVEALVELARLRGKKLGDIMDDLGIHGPEDAAAE